MKGTNVTFVEAARRIGGVSGHELSVTARWHVSTAKLQQPQVQPVVSDAHAGLVGTALTEQ